MPGGLDPRGPVAGEIAGLWWLMFWLGVAVMLVFTLALGRAMLGRRAGPRRESRGDIAPEALERAYIRRFIIWLGAVMTTVVLVVVLVFTIASMRAIPHTAAHGSLRLDLVAHQWYWDVRYPNGVTMRDTVRIPVGRQVELRIASEDVIHSFWVPSLAGKMDAVPGRINTLVIQADEPGRYRGQCAEFCGLRHAQMRVEVIAMEPSEFARWLERAS